VSTTPLEQLLERLEEARSRLEASAGDPDAALQALGEVSQLVSELTAEIDRLRQEVRDERLDAS
jgi:hypothetical protein